MTVSSLGCCTESALRETVTTRLTLGEAIGCDFKPYPYVQGWLARIKTLKSWKSVNATLDGVTAAHKGESFVTV